MAADVARLERENRRLQRQLEKAELIITFKKKPASCWGSRRGPRPRRTRSVDGSGGRTRITGGDRCGLRSAGRSPRELLSRAAVIEVLHQTRFADLSVREVYAALLDDGRYLCSIATMYRRLRALGESRERRAQRQHPRYAMPRLVAAAPNQVWTWDITKLGGPVKWLYFSLYAVLDIFSRYVVGWLVAERESHELAGRLLTQSMAQQGVTPGTLTVHSDRGAPMKATPLAQLLADLGVTRSLSRPRVSNDNPFSESHFKTLKYCPAFPQRFGSLVDARAFCRMFFAWYNHEHHHTGLGLLTPHSVHYGLAEGLLAARQTVLAG